MNGKIVYRTNFLNCLNYVFSKKETRLIGSNMVGETLTELNKEFNLIASKSDRLQKPVMHLSLSPHPDDTLNDSEKKEFTTQLLAAVGMEKCQWVLAEHNDTITPDGKLRPHFHAIINRVPLNDNKAVNSSWIKRRIEIALQKLREDFGLKQVNSSWLTERSAPTTAQVRRIRYEQQQYEKKERLFPPELPVLVQFQNTIDNLTQDTLTMPELVEQLKLSGINTEFIFTDDNQIKGIVYSQGTYHFSGRQLGRAYTFYGLQKYRRVNYNYEEDFLNLQAFRETEKDITLEFKSGEFLDEIIVAGADNNINHQIKQQLLDTNLGNQENENRTQIWQKNQNHKTNQLERSPKLKNQKTPEPEL